MSAETALFLGFVVMAIGLLMYSVRTKTFFIFPGQKREPAKWYEALIAVSGFVIFIFFILGN